MGITEILRRIWLFSANKIKSSESFSKQPTQLIIKLNSSLQHIIATHGFDLAMCQIFWGDLSLSINKKIVLCGIWPIFRPSAHCGSQPAQYSKRSHLIVMVPFEHFTAQPNCYKWCLELRSSSQALTECYLLTAWKHEE